jgi:Asparagine synthase
MSWLFGILQKQNPLSVKIKIDEEFQKVETKNLFLAVSNSRNSSLVTTSQSDIQAYVGIPIIDIDGNKRIINHDLFSKLNSIKPQKLFGHFIYINYSDNRIIISNDTFGLRELYYFENKEQIIFSTRIDLIQCHIADFKINSEVFSSLWLTNFQLSNNSIINEIKRLGPAGTIYYDWKELRISNNKFTKSVLPDSVERFPELVSKYCNNNFHSYENMSLALSGGIDSRFILSILLKNEQKFHCHTLVNEENNDLKISEEICRKFDIKHELLPRENLSIAESEDQILSYYKNIPPTIPLTQLLDFGFYGINHLKDNILLDGGFGGFYRRQYLNKLYLKGLKKFDIDSAEEIRDLLFAPKPPIFNNIFQDQLEKSLYNIVVEMISGFASSKNESDLAEILDLISIEFMLSNIYGSGQTILDQKLVSIMPLAQKDVIDFGMNIFLGVKKDSKLFKNLIRNNETKLAQINLVNNNLENPFYLNYKLAMIKLLLHRKFIKSNNYERYIIFMSSKEYIYDLLSSNSVKNNDYLEYKENMKMVSQFFNGDLSKGEYVDWLLTFVLWSKAINL